MNVSTNETRASLVFVLPHGKVGRRKNFGTIGTVEGQQVMCLGYTADGESVVYAKLSHLKDIAKAINRSTRDPLYQLLKWLMSRHEVGNKAQEPSYWGGTRGARARHDGAIAGSIGSIVPKSL